MHGGGGELSLALTNSQPASSNNKSLLVKVLSYCLLMMLLPSDPEHCLHEQTDGSSPLVSYVLDVKHTLAAHPCVYRHPCIFRLISMLFCSFCILANYTSCAHMKKRDFSPKLKPEERLWGEFNCNSTMVRTAEKQTHPGPKNVCKIEWS